MSFENWSLQTAAFDDPTPAKTVTAIANLNLATMGLNPAIVQAVVTFGDAADGDATIVWYYSADGGTTVSTERTDTVAYVVSTTKAYSLRVLNQPFLRVTVTNGNTAVQDITVSLKIAGARHGHF